MITNFRGKYGFLSNFYECSICYEGLTYGSVESAYQASKTTDMNVRYKFTTMKPTEAKKHGKSIKLRRDWNNEKIKIMYDLVKLKFSDRTLKTLLLNTENEKIVEVNTWGDTFWGVCDGVGSNYLGKILMLVRKQSRNEHDQRS